jgi:hypothetical protein
MKRRFILLLALALLLAACNGVIGGREGSGKVITEERDASGFERVRVTGSGIAEIVQGDTESLVIEAEDNIMPLVESTVQDGVLVLGQKASTSIRITKPIKYIITMIDVAGFEVTGSGAINSDSIETTLMSFDISGSGDINVVELDGDSIDALISGSGVVQISGDVADQVLEITGSGRYEGANLRSGTAVVSISGSGKAAVWVDTTLDITVTGSGEVSYYGEPILTQSISGSGNVRSLGAK